VGVNKQQKFGRIFLRATAKKPGFPLQVLGFARLHGRTAILLCKIATSPPQILWAFRYNPLRVPCSGVLRGKIRNH
jgi:hypothetical protein